MSAPPTPPAADESREIDVLVWGATGYTGRLVADYLARHHANSGLRLAIGGRDRGRLEALRRSLSPLLAGESQLSVVTGDALDLDALRDIARRCRVVCTTVGPYARLGEPLLAACAESGTDYCDLAGEITFMRRMIDTHDEQARRTRSRIVHCCGFDAIPSDLGVLMVQNHMKEKHGVLCHRVKAFLTSSSGGVSGGTIESGFGELEAMRVDPSAQKILEDPYALNPASSRSGPDTPDETGVHFDEDLQSWVARSPFAHINSRIVRRTNALLDYSYGREFRYAERIGTGRGLLGYVRALGIETGLGAYRSVAQLPWASRLLRGTLLPAPGQGPSAAKRQRGHFTMDLIGQGTLRDGSVATVRGRVQGTQDPGYGETAKMLVQSALCLALDQIGTKGGVHTPASAMGPTLIRRLQQAGTTFQIR